jgi:hypothetical protein
MLEALRITVADFESSFADPVRTSNRLDTLSAQIGPNPLLVLG